MECNLALPAVKTDCYRKSFAYTGAKCWNALPDELKCERSFGAIKDRLVSLNLSIEVSFLHCYLNTLIAFIPRVGLSIYYNILMNIDVYV